MPCGREATSRYTRAALAALAGAIADAVDAAELLDVEVDQLAWVLALVVDDVGVGMTPAVEPIR